MTLYRCHVLRRSRSDAGRGDARSEAEGARMNGRETILARRLATRLRLNMAVSVHGKRSVSPLNGHAVSHVTTDPGHVLSERADELEVPVERAGLPASPERTEHVA